MAAPVTAFVARDNKAACSSIRKRARRSLAHLEFPALEALRLPRHF